MLLRYLICFLLLLALPTTLAHAQPQAADTASIGRLNRQAEQLIFINPEQSLTNARQALNLSRSGHYRQGEIIACRALWELCYDHLKHDLALTYARQGEQAAKVAGDKVEEARFCVRQSWTLLKKDQPSAALTLLLKCQVRLESQTNKLPLAIINRGIGQWYYRQEQFDKYEAYERQSVALLKKLPGQKAEYAESILELGGALMQQYKLDSAQYYYHKSIRLFKELKSPQLFLAYEYLGGALILKGELGQSRKLLNLALKHTRETKDLYKQATVLCNLASNYLQAKQPQLAVGYYQEALKISEKRKDLPFIKTIQGNLYWTYKDLKQPTQALEHYEAYIDAQDSLFSLARRRELAEIEKKYETEKKQRQIELLLKTRQLAEATMAKRTTERNGLIAGLAITLIAGGLSIRSVRNRQRVSALLSEKNEEINQQRIRDLKWEQQLATIKASLEGQEKERMRIGQDLHDRLGSMLSAVKLYFYLSPEMRAMFTPKQLERHELANKLLDDSCQEVRRIAHDMVSNVLIRFGLVTALEELAQTINESNQVRMKLSCHYLNHRLDSTIEVTVYRIVQELVNNALKHARASEITLSLINKDDKMLHLIFQDNGIGFDPLKAENGMGMRNLQARTTQLGGTLEYDSAPERGTVITLDIPLPEQPVLQHSAVPLLEPELSSS